MDIVTLILSLILCFIGVYEHQKAKSALTLNKIILESITKMVELFSETVKKESARLKSMKEEINKGEKDETR